MNICLHIFNFIHNYVGSFNYMIQNSLKRLMFWILQSIIPNQEFNNYFVSCVKWLLLLKIGNECDQTSYEYCTQTSIILCKGISVFTHFAQFWMVEVCATKSYEGACGFIWYLVALRKFSETEADTGLYLVTNRFGLSDSLWYLHNIIRVER